MGWYENAFGIMRDCYEELAREPGAPLATWRDAFSAFDRIGVVDQVGAEDWMYWSAIFPPGEGLPGDPLPAGHRWTASTYMVRGAQLLATLFETIRKETGDLSQAIAPQGASPAELVSRFLDFGELATLAGMIHGASVLGALFEQASPVAPSVLTTFVDALASSARVLIEQRIGDDFARRRVWQVIDLTIATLRGGLRSGLLTDPRGFDAIDDYDCREWLRMNGASEASLQSGYLRALYDLGFSYEDGDPGRPSISAGQALRGMMRTFFTYRGAFFWKMHAGMGDVVFAPLYEVLERRGVRFEFFHLLRNVKLASDGESSYVEALELDVQANVQGGLSYRPLVDICGLPSWPAEPDYAQLVDGESLRAKHADLEHPAQSPVVGHKVLRVGVDFDLVVLGIGLGAVPEVCREIVATNPAWQSMVEHVKTVATQAFQIWLTEDMEGLGWKHGPVALSGFVEPFDTWADMTHLIPLEEWKDATPGALAYFCSVLPDDEASSEHPRAIVRAGATDFLERHIRKLWPAAVTPDGKFRWDILAGEGNGTTETGPERFATQFWTANVAPSDRYVLSVPGSAKHRISPLDRTYDNLTIAGDWTACGFNAGCVEAAVMSGRLAANALSGLPRLENIVGYDHP
jgi:uncharacterized protein with NAD-binding domain and iron-sulfur cluster